MKERLSRNKDGGLVVPRSGLTGKVRHALRAAPVTALLDPRQCGKTTLARQVAAGKRATTSTY